METLPQDTPHALKWLRWMPFGRELLVGAAVAPPPYAVFLAAEHKWTTCAVVAVGWLSLFPFFAWWADRAKVVRARVSIGSAVALVLVSGLLAAQIL